MALRVLVVATAALWCGEALTISGQTQGDAQQTGGNNQNVNVGPNVGGGRRRLSVPPSKPQDYATVVSGRITIENPGQRCLFTQYNTSVLPEIVRFPCDEFETIVLPEFPTEADGLPDCTNDNMGTLCSVGKCNDPMLGFPFIKCEFETVNVDLFGDLVRTLNYEFVDSDPDLCYYITSLEGDFRDIAENTENTIFETVVENDAKVDVKDLPDGYCPCLEANGGDGCAGIYGCDGLSRRLSASATPPTVVQDGEGNLRRRLGATTYTAAPTYTTPAPTPIGGPRVATRTWKCVRTPCEDVCDALAD